LQDLHDRHPPIIHRDIKPSNILLTDRSGNSPGKVYLIDFGSVQTLATQAGKTVTVVGTYGYMPPEQFGGISSPASDLYSVGMTAIALLTRTHPADLPQENLYIQFQSFTSISQSFTSWLQQITEPHPSQRFTSAQQALSILNAPIARSTESRPSPATPNYLGEAILYSVRMSIWACGMTAIIITVIALITAGPAALLLFAIFSTLTAVGWGAAVGVLNGLIVGIISRLKFNALRDFQRHYLAVSGTSLISLITIGWFAFTVSPSSGAATDVGLSMSSDFRWTTIPFLVVAAGTMLFVNYQLILKWHRRKDT
jgi:eukaryotic-like serine/threonine-protein kinase